MEVRDTFNDFLVQTDGTMDEGFTISKDSLQDAMIRLFNRFISEAEIAYEITNCEECDASFDELTYGEFKALYYRF